MHHYPFNIGDYRKDTPHLSLIQHGAYRQLLDWCYASEKALPTDPDMLCRICGAVTKPEREAVTSVLEEFFSLEPEGWINKRVAWELDIYDSRRSGAAKTNRRRWGKGNPNGDPIDPPNADAVAPGVAQAVAPGIADAVAQPSLNGSQPRDKRQETETPTPSGRGRTSKRLTAPVFPEGVPESLRLALTTWWNYKRELRQAYTPSGWLALVDRESAFPPETVQASIRMSMANGWQGLFTEKVTASTGTPAWGKNEKGGAALPVLETPVARTVGPPEDWEQAMAALWGADWAQTYAAWELMPPADQRQVRAWLAKRPVAGELQLQGGQHE